MFDRAGTQYDHRQRKCYSPIPIRDSGYYSEFVILNFTKHPIYVQDHTGVTCEIPIACLPGVYDRSYYDPMGPRVSIRKRITHGPRYQSENAPRIEAWEGDIDEYNISTDVLIEQDIYVKEINMLISFHMIEEGRHFHTNSNEPILEVPETLSGIMAEESMKQNAFSIVVNSHDLEIKYVYTSINGTISRVKTIHDTTQPERLVVTYIDVNGQVIELSLCDTNTIIDTTEPIKFNNTNMFVSTNPKKLAEMIATHGEKGLTSESLKLIKERAVESVKSKYESKIEELTLKIKKLDNNNKDLTAKNEALERRRYAEREYDTRDARYRSVERKAKSEERIATSKERKETTSFWGGVLKVIAVAVPLAVGIAKFFM